jgi:hypothetical protein
MVHAVYGFTQDEIDTYAIEILGDVNVVSYRQLLEVLMTLKRGGIEFCLNKDIVKPQQVREAVVKQANRLERLKAHVGSFDEAKVLERIKKEFNIE